MSFNLAIPKETRSREQMVANGAYIAERADKAFAESYVGDGSPRWPAAHVVDVARLYVLTLERGRCGARYHAVAEECIPTKDIAKTIGRILNLPVDLISVEAAFAHFGPLSIYADVEGSHPTVDRLRAHRGLD